jgi:acetolactate synthase-1/2/3 large subunit
MDNGSEAPSALHPGEQAVTVLASYGVDTMFTLNGGHVWPIYEGARHQGVRVIDTRHEQTATFAAEAWAKLTRRPGLAVLTAGPGVTNGVSAITSAHFNGSPLVVLGGRAPAQRWGAGSLQELDHVPIVASVTKSAGTVSDPAKAALQVQEAVVTALTPHRGPVFVDFPLDVIFEAADVEIPPAVLPHAAEPDLDAVDTVAALIARAERPAFVIGSDVYWRTPRRPGNGRPSGCRCRAGSTAWAGAVSPPITRWRSPAPAAC